MLIKICCIQSEGEVEMALAAGATHPGLVASTPSGPGPIPDERLASLVRVLPAHATPVLLTSRTHPEQIIQHVRSTGARAVQIVQEVPVAVRNAVRGALPGVDILQVVHIIGPESLEEARRASVASDYVLLDSGRPSATTRELGGTGHTHDWAVSARIVSEVLVPVFLAGGLKLEKVGEAVRAVGPAGVALGES